MRFHAITHTAFIQGDTSDTFGPHIGPSKSSCSWWNKRTGSMRCACVNSAQLCSKVQEMQRVLYPCAALMPRTPVTLSM